MRILFIHQNFPGQFKHLAPALAARPGWEVRALAIENQPAPHGVQVTRYRPRRGTSSNIHPWVADIETKVLRGEAALHAMLRLRHEGFTPDLVFAHSGWGESLFVKDVWPDVPLLVYSEFFYQQRGTDVGFDPEFERVDASELGRLRMKNANPLLNLAACDWAVSPTGWQRATVPPEYQPKISVIHDGIDTGHMRPDAAVVATLGNGLRLTAADEVITYVARNLEPYRGFHVFMRALPEILRRRPRARVLIIGGDDVSYGAGPEDGKSFRQRYLEEVGAALDMSRVHFLGRVPYADFRRIVQLSAVHVYLTYPFVLSWSMLEAMSCGALVVGSATPPVCEVIEDGRNGLLVDFFDTKGVADAVDRVLDDPERLAAMRRAARETVVERYDLRSVCLPRMSALVEALARRAAVPEPVLPVREAVQMWPAGRAQ